MGPSNSDAPDQAQAYKDGIITYLTYLPDLLRAEASARSTYDPQRIQQQQDLQEQYGPNQYRQQLEALGILDPESTAVRRQLAGRVSGDLESGYQLPEDFSRELETNIRGAQAARGQGLGTASANAESAYKGQSALDLYYRRLGAAGTFLSSPTPIQQLAGVQGVMPDRTSAYTNPSAGYAGQNFALANYNNQLTQANAQGNPWANALGGAAQGASAGSSAGIWGTLIGAAAGGAAGYFGSSAAIKKDIVKVGISPKGVDIVEFTYRADPEETRYRGAIAEQVRDIFPNAVAKDSRGILMVNYGETDVSFCRL